MDKSVTLFDLADALGISTGTVHRALHDHPGVSAATKARVLKMAKTLGYRPNLAARFLSSKRNLSVSVNTLQGTTSFWDEVRAGISEEARSLLLEKIDVQFRTYPHIGDGEEEAFEEAVKAQVDGIVIFPTDITKLRSWIQKASNLRIPIVCVATDAPGTERLAVVSIDALASGALAADLMGRIRGGKGKAAVTLSCMAIAEHAEKHKAFGETLASYYPQMSLLEPIEDGDVESVAYDKCRRLFEAHPDLSGIYVTTEASIPVIQAARDAGVLPHLTIITTDLFPALVPEIRSGTVVATIYQRPRTQGRMAFRTLHGFVAEGQYPTSPITLAPHLVMRGNLDFFLQRQSLEPDDEMKPQEVRSAPAPLQQRFG
ncbi:MAG TPA: LacI family DNA-binding transcriptional regulator [Terriglobales bacterium]|jgi:LacI family transcriptional regulator|nr:LacI family DNA-binding transcriptional regulator [Terriglobales bacterium]